MKSFGKSTYCLTAIALLAGCLDTVHAQDNTFMFSALTPFNTVQGQSPASQTLDVTTSTGAAVNFAKAVGGDSQCTSVVQFGNYTLASTTSVPIFMQTASLQPGTYHCSITFSAAGFEDGVVNATINVSASGTGALTVNKASLDFSAQTNSSPVTDTLTLTNSNSATPIQYTASVTPSNSWLSISGTSGTVTTTSTISVQADPAGLTASSTPYTGSITITPTNVALAPILVSVSFTVSANPSLQVTENGVAVDMSTGVQFFYQTGTSLPASQTLHFASSNSSQNLQFTLTASSTTASFLVLNQSGTLNTPQDVVLQLASTASSLPPNTYSGTLDISAPGAANPSFSIPVSLEVSASPFLTLVGAPAGPFNFTIGGSNPADQTVQIGTTSTALPVSAAATMASGESWLTLGLSSPTASAAQPSTLTLSANPSGLAPGPHAATVTITSTGAANSISFPVTLNVSAGTMLNATPAMLTFTFETGGTVPSPATVTVSSTGNSLPFTVTTATSGGDSTCTSVNWLQVSENSGTATTTGATFQASVSPVGVTPGVACSGTITIASSGATNTVTIPVTLETSGSALLTLNQSAFAFTGPLGTVPGNTQTLTLQSTDSSTVLTFNISNPAPWLNVSPTVGSTPANVLISLNAQQAATLAVGPHVANLTINAYLPNSQSALPQPITVPVTYTVTALIQAAVSHTSLQFTQAANGPAPASQTVDITVSGTGSGSVNAFTATASSFGNWLSVSPANGAVPGTVTVSVNGATLSPSSTPYQGSVIISVPGAANSPITVPVSLTVGPAQSLVLNATSLTFAGAVGATPASQAFNVSSSAGSVAFTVAAASNTPSCGNFLSATPATGTATSTPQPITVSVNSTNVPAGTCSGTVTVGGTGVAAQSVSVTYNVSAAAAPQITYIENAASFALGGIAPGELISIFGSAIGPSPGVLFTPTATNQMPTTVSGVQVLFDGTPAALYYVSATQINLIVPYEVLGKSSVGVTVMYNNQVSNTIQQAVVNTVPAIFTTNTPAAGEGQAAVINEDGTLNGPDHPAPKGTVVEIYATGGGVPSPRPATYTITGTTNLPSVLQNTSLTIGGQAATLSYAGDAPYFTTGFLQINAEVPMSIAGSGAQKLVLTISGNSNQFTQDNVTMYVQ
jgi:uncharacterized protein (TIGR03437 family)